jgi:hypothetical protein
MAGRRALYWLALVVLPALALGHGFAGAATHLPHHPAGALVATAAGSPESYSVESHRHGVSGEDDTSCQVGAGGGPGSRDLAESGCTVGPLGDGCPPDGPRGCAVGARSPPAPSLTVLSVWRI